MEKVIYLDMDGVLCDFFTSAFYKVNDFLSESGIIQKSFDLGDYPIGEYGIEKFFGISVPSFWDIIDRIGDPEDFWYNLPAFDWTRELYRELNRIAPVVICTKPHNHPSCLSGKLKWLNDRLDISVNNVIFICDKSKLSREGAFLIDDCGYQKESFESKGGTFVEVPSTWSKNPLSREDVFNAIAQSNLVWY